MRTEEIKEIFENLKSFISKNAGNLLSLLIFVPLAYFLLSFDSFNVSWTVAFIVVVVCAGIYMYYEQRKKVATSSPDENVVKVKKSWVMTPLFPLTKWLTLLACIYMVGMFVYLANVTTTVLPVSSEGETSFKLTETYYTFKLKADQDILYRIPPYGGVIRKSGQSAPESSSGYEGHGKELLVKGNGPTSYVKLLQYNHIYLENLFPLYSWL